MHYIKYRPAFFEGFDEIEFDFTTTAELLAHEDMKNWLTLKGFKRFLVTSNGEDRMIFTEFENGEHWGAAVITGSGFIDLPVWKVDS